MSRPSLHRHHIAPTRWLGAWAFLLTLSLATPRTTQAAPPIVRPTTHSFYATFGLGGAFTLSGDLGLIDFPSQFKIEQAFGWHLLGGGSGPALALHIGENFGSVRVPFAGSVSIFGFQLQARFLWDFQPMSDVGLYLAPYLGLGFSHAGAGDPCSGDMCTEEAFSLSFGFEARLALGGVGLFFARLVSFDFNFGEETIIRYELLFGGGIYFL